MAVAMLSRSWVSSSYRMISVWGTDMVPPPWYAGLNLGAGLMTVRMSVCMCRRMCCLIMDAISNSNWCCGMRGSHGGTFFSEAGRRRKKRINILGKIQGDGRKFLDQFKSYFGSQVSWQSINEVHVYQLQPKSAAKGEFFIYFCLYLSVPVASCCPLTFDLVSQ